MKTRYLGFYTLSSYVVFLAALVCPGPLSAQDPNTYDLQIMVNGPWDYAKDLDPVADCKYSSGDRIVLVAPAMNGADKIHQASIFSGTYASQTPPATALHPDPSVQGDLALYCVDINRGTASPQANPQKDEPADFYKSYQIPDEKIRQIIQPGVNGHPKAYRFAISLPRPDYVTTYTGSYGTGFAESKKQWVFYTDGDGQFDPAELELLVQRASADVDVVQGYKLRRADGVLRTVIGRVYHRFVKIMFGLHIRDTDCDFRLIRREALERILGCDADTAARAAAEMLADPHPAVAMALAMWHRGDIGERFGGRHTLLCHED